MSAEAGDGQAAAIDRVYLSKMEMTVNRILTDL